MRAEGRVRSGTNGPLAAATQASRAAPELVAALPAADPVVVAALLAVGQDASESAGLLREHAVLLREHAGSIGDLGGALAIHRITGEAAPLLDLLQAILSGR